MLSVIIIDNTPVLRFGIKYFLEGKFDDVFLTEFSSLQDCNLYLDARTPDLIFLGGDLVQIPNVQKLNNIYETGKLIVYDPEGKAEDGIKYLRSGAQGYLSKRSDSATFECCIKTVLEGKFYIDPVDLNTLLTELVHNNTASRKQIVSYSLTPRQSQIAKLYAQGMSTSGIASKLGLRSSTVSTVKSTIYGKLNVNSVIGIKEVIG